MSTHYGLSTIYQNNPYDRKARTTGAMMGNSGFAKPFLAMAMGQQTSKAGAWDEKQAGERAGQAKANQFLKTFQSLATVSKGDAVALWNEQAKDMLGADFKIDSALDSPEMLSIKAKDGLWYGLDKRTGKIMVSDGGEWRAPTEEDRKNIGTSDRKTLKDVTGKQRYLDTKEEVFPGVEKDTAGATDSFRQWIGQLNTLYGKKSSVLAGLNPMTNEPLAEEDRQAALEPITKQIRSAETYMKTNFAEEWKTYSPPQMPPRNPAAEALMKTPGAGQVSPAPGAAPVPGQAPAPIQRAPVPGGGQPLDQATALQILKSAGGDANLARKIARDAGYTF